jgi:hypothetical protein
LPNIRTLVDAFGPRRTFWGIDLTRMPCTYYECITLCTEHLPWLQGEDLEWAAASANGWAAPCNASGRAIKHPLINLR